MYFIITVDVEAENQWDRPLDMSSKNVAFLPRFQDLCEKYGFKPTYLLSYEIMENEASVRLLKGFQSRGGVEIGAHLHPWTSPPYDKEISWERKVHRFPMELNDKELKDKLTVLTDIIKEKFGKSPVSFRAGRWGADGRVFSVLEELGYIADCSVTPKINWEDTKGDPAGRGGPDFRLTPSFPYRPDKNNISKIGNMNILEVPMTILFTSFLNKEDSVWSKMFLGIPDSLIRKVINKLFFRIKWLRIFSESTQEDFIKIYKSAKKNNLPVVEFMIHSSELMPGGSPYAKTKEDVEMIYKKLEQIFEYFKEKGIEGITLGDFAKKYEGNK